jgi:hypothetical protein
MLSIPYLILTILSTPIRHNWENKGGWEGWSELVKVKGEDIFENKAIWAIGDELNSNLPGNMNIAGVEFGGGMEGGSIADEGKSIPDEGGSILGNNIGRGNNGNIISNEGNELIPLVSEVTSYPPDSNFGGGGRGNMGNNNGQNRPIGGGGRGNMGNNNGQNRPIGGGGGGRGNMGSNNGQNRNGGNMGNNNGQNRNGGNYGQNRQTGGLLQTLKSSISSIVHKIGDKISGSNNNQGQNTSKTKQNTNQNNQKVAAGGGKRGDWL